MNEIQQVLNETGILQKDLAIALGMSPQLLSYKKNKAQDKLKLTKYQYEVLRNLLK